MNCKRYYCIIGVLLGLFIGINNLQAQMNSLTVSELAISNEPMLLANDNNGSSVTNERIENYKQFDRFGIVMTITAMGIGFLGLIGLYLLFYLIGTWGISLIRKRAITKYGMSKEEAKGITKRSGEIYAAIAMAIYEATETHDDENTILTIKNTVRNYSPWSSKIYSLREVPKR